jgi:hypothetical protein
VKVSWAKAARQNHPDHAELPYICIVKAPTTFEWDDAKAAIHLVKHKVPFPYAARVFLDPGAVTVGTIRAQNGEPRYKAIGRIDGKLYVAVFVLRGGAVCCLISARRTNAKEDRIYGDH